MAIEQSLKNAMLTANGLVSWSNNEPTQYAGKQHQYFSPESRTFTQMFAKYSSDFVEAQMQGLDPSDPYAYQTRMIRFADIVKPTAAIQRNFDDYKMILVADRDIEYIMPGSKIQALGCTWLVFNPLNGSGSDGCAVIRRCNAVWNFLDYYGNVISEPIIAENSRANANDSDAQQSLLISKGYFNIYCQYNDYTRQIDTNTRMILGTAAYRVTGFSDFEMEYTGDYSSVRTLYFSVRVEDKNDATDDMERHVANGKAFSWSVSIGAQNNMSVGQTAQFEAYSIRNGAAVSSTPQNPISYIWSSSDESVATVDENGLVTAISDGSAEITAYLAQNPMYSATAALTVIPAESHSGVDFVSPVPQSLSAFQTVTLEARHFADGDETDDPLVWSFTGADATAYSATVANDGLSATIQCFGYSETPLVITATFEDPEQFATAQIRLEGI